MTYYFTTMFQYKFYIFILKYIVVAASADDGGDYDYNDILFVCLLFVAIIFF
jgi:hypothetical protein